MKNVRVGHFRELTQPFIRSFCSKPQGHYWKTHPYNMGFSNSAPVIRKLQYSWDKVNCTNQIMLHPSRSSKCKTQIQNLIPVALKICYDVIKHCLGHECRKLEAIERNIGKYLHTEEPTPSPLYPRAPTQATPPLHKYWST